MSESQLPPVYMPKEHKRIRIDPLHGMEFVFSSSLLTLIIYSFI